MELIFPGVNSRVAGELAAELRRELVKAGAPPQSVTIKPSSPEHMNLGTVLGIDVSLALQVLEATGYIACFGHCMLEIMRKHEVSIRLMTKTGPIDIAARNAGVDTIEKILADLRATKKDL